MGPRAALVLAALSAIGLCGCAEEANSAMYHSDLAAEGSDMSALTDGAFCEPAITIMGDPALLWPWPAPLAREVRLPGEGGPDAITTAAAGGSFAVAVNPDLKDTPLIIPAGTALAPSLLAQTAGVSLGGVSFATDSGVLVSGTRTDPGGAPIGGARVVLRAGKLPSGTGISAGDGSYALRAQPG